MCEYEGKSKALEATMWMLQDKAEFLFAQLQSRDKDLQSYTKKLDEYRIVEAKMATKIKELEGDAEYYRVKYKEVCATTFSKRCTSVNV
jgi:hypothetical protein